MSDLIQIGKLSIRSSSVKTKETCDRQWWFDWVIGRWGGNDATRLGSEVHTHLEAWLLRAQTPPENTKSGNLANRLIRLPGYLPPPLSPHIAVESGFSMPTYPGGPLFTGTKDWQDVTGQDGVGDHKTTSTLHYALTDNTILDNVQAMAYAKSYADEHKLDRVRLRWGYVETKGHSQKLVDQIAQLDNIAKRWERTLKSVREMADTYDAKPDWQQVKPNWSACDMYRGCPHKSRCEATKKASVAVGVNPILARLRAGQNIVPGESPSATEAVKAIQRVTEPEPMPPPQVLARGITPPDAPPPSFEAGEEKPAKRTRKQRIAGSAPSALTEANEIMPQISSLSEPTPPAEFDEDGRVSDEPSRALTGSAACSKIVVYIGCAPTKGSRGALYLEDVLRPLEIQVASFAGEPHYKSIGFGKGPGLLANALSDWLADNPSTNLIVAGLPPSEVMSVLLSRADVVIQGLR